MLCEHLDSLLIFCAKAAEPRLKGRAGAGPAPSTGLHVPRAAERQLSEQAAVVGTVCTCPGKLTHSKVSVQVE